MHFLKAEIKVEFRTPTHCSFFCRRSYFWSSLKSVVRGLQRHFYYINFVVCCFSGQCENMALWKFFGIFTKYMLRKYSQISKNLRSRLMWPDISIPERFSNIWSIGIRIFSFNWIPVFLFALSSNQLFQKSIFRWIQISKDIK